MPLDADALLSGPRGRRLCLEAATGDGNVAPTAGELRTLVRQAAHEFEPDSGQSARYLTSSSRWSLHWGSPTLEPAWTFEHLHDRLAATRLRLDPAAMLESLSQTVDRAMYWQPPDGEDVLAASPELADALRGIARQVLDHPAASWWADPLDSDSQRVVHHTAHQGGAAARPAAEALSVWREETLATERRAQRDTPRDPAASFSGDWWSAPVSVVTSSTRDLGEAGPVGLHLVEDRFGWERALVLPLEVTPTSTYELDGPDAWAELCHRFPLEVTASRRHDWYRVTGWDSEWVIPDWSAVAREYDAVHLSLAGYLTTAGRGIPLTETHSTVLAGWDPDQTYWLRDVDPDASRAERWHRTDENDAWRRMP
ncbi:hypothetical protein [Desertivibrio insolitus]|uniref:hypothetical protein n=1 Tax=Herbiconiux sp. SYSU D00978 TaxID=2812562 RepID=UPI001A95AF88|nr:hypothetical protein [Herbiconiux sp. SYSU D00978]